MLNGFAELTIDNGQLTIIVSLRDDFKIIPKILFKTSRRDPLIVNFQLSIVN